MIKRQLKRRLPNDRTLKITGFIIYQSRYFVLNNKHVIFFVLLFFLSILSSHKRGLTGHSTTFAYQETPVLCYHNINTKTEKEDFYRISSLHFEQQIRTLYDSGYHSIVPDQLYDHLTKGTPLPSKPVMFTFDDTHEGHLSIAAAILEKYRYKGVFFIMTVCIGKKNYLTSQQIKMLAERGHAVESHTYDHPLVKNIQAKQWEQQVDKPKKKLEAITGKPVDYFAYPFGVWNEQAIIELKNRGVKAAFQLTGKKSQKEPLYTIKRMLVSGAWSGRELQKHIAGSFR